MLESHKQAKIDTQSLIPSIDDFHVPYMIHLKSLRREWSMGHFSWIPDHISLASNEKSPPGGRVGIQIRHVA